MRERESLHKRAHGYLRGYISSVVAAAASSTQSRRVLVVETTGTISDMHCSLLYSYGWRGYSQQL